MILICMPLLTVAVMILLNGMRKINTSSRPDISNQTVKCFGEDSLGYIWIGTGRGLNRFNGYELYSLSGGERFYKPL